MSERWWRHEPERDESHVGISLADILFGLVLTQAFAPTVHDYHKISIAGFTQLGLAVETIILSWIGYHNNRRSGNTWALTFLNIPLLQFVIDILIVAAYWILIVTTESIDPTYFKISAVPESAVLVAVFGLYLGWDSLEILINEDKRYVDKMAGPATPLRTEVQTRSLLLGSITDWRHPKGSGAYYATPARVMRSVTLTFLAVFVATSVLVGPVLHVHGHVSVPVVDSVLAVIVFSYRVLQANIERRCVQRPKPPKKPTSAPDGIGSPSHTKYRMDPPAT